MTFRIGTTAVVVGEEGKLNAVIDLGGAVKGKLWVVPYVGSVHSTERPHLLYSCSYFAADSPRTVTALWHEEGPVALQLAIREARDLLLGFLSSEQLDKLEASGLGWASSQMCG
jgi:hypothetical protein